jgi:hypothetical protein
VAITTLTLKPNLTGAVTQALHDRNPFYIPAGGLALPVVAYDEEYAESIFMEGGRRTRSREQNPEGKVTLRVTPGLSDATLRTRLTELQQTIQACRIYGGELALALEGQPTVTYDLESCSLASLDLEEVQFGRAVVEINVVTRPYGRLAPVALVVNATSSDPIQSVSLAGIGGSAPALVEATVTDTATQGRDHLEVGLDSDWDGSSVLLTDSSAMSVSGLSGVATTKTGAYSSSGVIRTAGLGTSAIGCCEKTGLTHRGRHRAKLRLAGAGLGPIYVRVAFRVGSGPWTRNSWRKVQSVGTTTANSPFYELDMGLVQGSPAGTLSVRIEAYSASGSAVAGDTLDIDYLLLIPVSVWAKARGAVDNTGTAFSAYDAFDQPTRTNLIANPSFETDTAGWSTSSPAYHMNSGATLTRQTPVIAQQGSYVGQIVTPGAAAAEGMAFAFSGYTFTAGVAYTLSMSIMASASTDCDLVLGKASADCARSDITATTTWTRFSVTWTPAADGTSVYAVLRTDLGGSPQARTIQVDAVMVEQASSAGTYFDGTSTGGSWSGTAHASTSQLSLLPLSDGYAAPIGGNWAVTNRTGANGWVIETTGKTAQRTILSDTFSGANYGAFAQLGSAVAAGSVQGKVKFSTNTETNVGLQSFGLLARYVNKTNWVALVMQPSVYGAYLTLIKNVGGTISGIASLNSGYFAVTNFFHPLRLELDADGSYRAYWSGSLMFSGNDPDLSSTGALASGKRGLIDAMGSAIANTRNYDDFATTEPTAQRVVNASGAVILDSDSIARSDGSRPAIFEGSYLKSPPAGREARTHRLAVKLRRNDVDTAPDDQIADGQRVDVTVIPRVVLL